MHKIYFATKNKGKVNTLTDALSRHAIEIVHTPLDMPEPRTDNLQEIAKEKILFAYEQIKKPCIAMDAGFYIHSLRGFPKTFVNLALETIDIDGILRLVQGKPRECEFRNCLAYLDSALSEPLYFESKVEGTLSEAPRGEMRDYYWSRLFLIFIPKNMNKTLAEMDLGEYREWRMHGLKDSASSRFAEWVSARADY